MVLESFMERCVRFNYPNLAPSKKYCFCCKSPKILGDVAVTHMVHKIEDLTSSPNENAHYFACIDCYYLAETLDRYKIMLRSSVLMTEKEVGGNNVVERLILENKKAKAQRKPKRKRASRPSAGDMFDLQHLPKLPTPTVKLSRVTQTHRVLPVTIRADENGYTSDICTTSLGATSLSTGTKKLSQSSKYIKRPKVSVEKMNGYMSDGDIPRVRQNPTVTVTPFRIGRPIKRKLDDDFVWNFLEVSPETVNGHANDDVTSQKRPRGRPRKQSHPKQVPNPHLQLYSRPKQRSPQHIAFATVPPPVQSPVDVDIDAKLTQLQPIIKLKRVTEEFVAKFNRSQTEPVVIEAPKLTAERDLINESTISNLTDSANISGGTCDHLTEDLISFVDMQNMIPPSDLLDNDEDPHATDNPMMNDIIMSDLEDEQPILQQSTPAQQSTPVKNVHSPQRTNGNIQSHSDTGLDFNFDSLAIDSEESPADDSNSSLMQNGFNEHHEHDDDNDGSDSDSNTSQFSEVSTLLKKSSVDQRSPYRCFTMNSNRTRKAVTFYEKVQVHRYSPVDIQEDHVITSEDLAIFSPYDGEEDDTSISPGLDFAVESVFNEGVV